MEAAWVPSAVFFSLFLSILKVCTGTSIRTSEPCPPGAIEHAFIRSNCSSVTNKFGDTTYHNCSIGILAISGSHCRLLHALNLGEAPCESDIQCLTQNSVCDQEPDDNHEEGRRCNCHSNYLKKRSTDGLSICLKHISDPAERCKYHQQCQSHFGRNATCACTRDDKLYCYCTTSAGNSTKDSKSKIIWIIVGVVAGAIIIPAVIFFIWRWYSKRNYHYPAFATDAEEMTDTPLKATEPAADEQTLSKFNSGQNSSQTSNRAEANDYVEQ